MTEPNADRATTRERRDEAERLDQIAEKWLNGCPSCDAGLPAACNHPDEDYRPVMEELWTGARSLIALVESLSVERDGLKTGVDALGVTVGVLSDERDRLRAERDDLRAKLKLVGATLDEVAGVLNDTEAERDSLAAKITAVEALRGRFEAAAISCRALGEYEREADWRSVVGAINAALSGGGQG